MSHPPAAGERSALRGYRWQYDHIAVRVYDALLDGDLVSVRLVDPDAGRVDDLVLVRRGRVDGYQFKSSEFDGYVTFNQLTKDQRTRGGAPAPSLVLSLADGWNRLIDRYHNAHVHLVMQQLASINDHLGEGEGDERPSPDHLGAFLAQVLKPLGEGASTPEDISREWQPALQRLRDACGVTSDQFERFLQSMHLDFAAGTALPPAPSGRRSDIVALSDALFRAVSESAGVVELDQRAVLALMGWSDRHRLHSRHEFPVDLDTYAPLTDAIRELQDLLAEYPTGYLGVVGPPGSGKSTLLSQALSGVDAG